MHRPVTGFFPLSLKDDFPLKKNPTISPGWGDERDPVFSLNYFFSAKQWIWQNISKDSTLYSQYLNESQKHNFSSWGKSMNYFVTYLKDSELNLAGSHLPFLGCYEASGASDQTIHLWPAAGQGPLCSRLRQRPLWDFPLQGGLKDQWGPRMTVGLRRGLRRLCCFLHIFLSSYLPLSTIWGFINISGRTIMALLSFRKGLRGEASLWSTRHRLSEVIYAASPNWILTSLPSPPPPDMGVPTTALLLSPLKHSRNFYQLCIVYDDHSGKNSEVCVGIAKFKSDIYFYLLLMLLGCFDSRKLF